jgi:hypothetical protein
MKQTVVLLALGLLLLPACSRSRVSSSDLHAAFRSAEPALKTEAEKAGAAIRAGHYDEALAILQPLAHRAKLSADQQQAIKDTIAAVNAQIAADLKKPVPAKK